MANRRSLRVIASDYVALDEAASIMGVSTATIHYRADRGWITLYELVGKIVMLRRDAETQAGLDARAPSDLLTIREQRATYNAGGDQ